jgi:CubicO group peptidase (beta-lactamase class C family)
MPTRLLLLLAAACAQSPSGPANPDDGTTDHGEPVVWPDLPDLDAAIEAEMQRSHVPGLSACLIVGEELTWCQGYGLADLETERAVTPETPFLLASVSKTVTATALALAWQSDLIDLDADVDTLLSFAVDHPESPATPITPRMLASHVAGISDNWGIMDASYTDGGDSPIPLGEFLEDYLVPGRPHYNARRNFTSAGPGREAEYSNIGAAVVGHLVEEATGTSFDRWCEEQLFTPLGMGGTSWFLADMDPDTLAVPTEWRNGRHHEIGHYGFPDYPSGQLRAGAVDTARFLRAVMNGGAAKGVRVLDEATVTELLRVQHPSLDPDQGLGWYRWRLDGAVVWGHNGGESGAATEILWWPEREMGVVVLMNAEGRWDTLEVVERAIVEAAMAM